MIIFTQWSSLLRRAALAATLWLLCAASALAGGSGDGLRLTILHLNDAHSRVEPGELLLSAPGGQTARPSAGGAARLAAAVRAARSEAGRPVLTLHAGDFVQGTIWFSLLGGIADTEMTNLLGLDAMALGNHEFDRGPARLAEFTAQANWPLLCANLDASAEPALRGRIKPWIVKELDGRKVGVVGLTTERTPEVSSPGPNLRFADPVQAARKAVAELQALGVDVIVLLTHLGFDRDLELAREVPGVDVVVGGHSHTLLGDFDRLGLPSAGPYPAVVERADGERALVVQAWRWGCVLGRLDADFDAAGRIVSWRGAPKLVLGEPVLDEGRKELAKEALAGFEKELTASGLATFPGEAADAAARIEALKGQLEVYKRETVGEAARELPHALFPTPERPADGDVATHAAESVLAATAKQGARAALVNGGGVRADVPKGRISAAAVYALLPFGNTLVLAELSGAELKAVLEDGLRAIDRKGGGFPWTAGLRFAFDAQAPAGSRLLGAELREPDGSWRELRDEERVVLATNSFLASGKDGYATLGRIVRDPARRAQDTGLVDAEAFMDYVRERSPLGPPPAPAVVRASRP